MLYLAPVKHRHISGKSELFPEVPCNGSDIGSDGDLHLDRDFRKRE